MHPLDPSLRGGGKGDEDGDAERGEEGKVGGGAFIVGPSSGTSRMKDLYEIVEKRVGHQIKVVVGGRKPRWIR